MDGVVVVLVMGFWWVVVEALDDHIKYKKRYLCIVVMRIVCEWLIECVYASL